LHQPVNTAALASPTPNIYLRWITPTTRAECERYSEPLQMVLQRMDPKMNAQQWQDALLGLFTLVFAELPPGSVPAQVFVGIFCLTLFQKSAELHGVYAPYFDDARTFPPRLRRTIKHAVIATLLNTIFIQEGKQKLITKVRQDSALGRAFARRYGFTKMQHPKTRQPIIDHGRTVWVLTREQYVKK